MSLKFIAYVCYTLTLPKVSSCGMSDTIGPIHIKERPSSEMQSRIDAEASFLNI